MRYFLLYLWQLPQNLLGLILLSFYWAVSGIKWRRHPELVSWEDSILVYESSLMPSGISLGRYIILSEDSSPTARQHEMGHCKQSKKWGWLYLIVIGLPSLCGNIIDRLFHKNWEYKKAARWYYNLPWEKSADILGGVKR